MAQYEMPYCDLFVLSPAKNIIKWRARTSGNLAISQYGEVRLNFWRRDWWTNERVDGRMNGFMASSGWIDGNLSWFKGLLGALQKHRAKTFNFETKWNICTELITCNSLNLSTFGLRFTKLYYHGFIIWQIFFGKALVKGYYKGLA